MAGSKLNQEEFFLRYRIKQHEFKKTGLKWADLQTIFEDHEGRVPQLLPIATYFRDSLQQSPDVHSLKVRVKHPEHLIEKIIRKRLQFPDREITPDNYRKEVTDLVGVRALHLFKDEWLPIHELISKAWRLKGRPIANVRKGDPEDAFRSAGCVIKEHPAGYRSVHYIAKYQLGRDVQFVELQVRTIFEEGWSEIDHRIRYPHNVNNATLSQFLIIFNGLAGSADHMGTYIKFLSRQLGDMQANSEAQANKEAELTTEIEKLRRDVAKLQISVVEKEKLNQRLTSISSASSQPLFGMGQVSLGQHASILSASSLGPGVFGLSSGATPITLSNFSGVSQPAKLFIASSIPEDPEKPKK